MKILRNTESTKTEDIKKNLSRPILSKKIESVIKNFPTQKTHMVLLMNSTKHLKKN